MSDTPSAAPASSGPASASDAQLTGRFAEEARAGYRSMPEPQKREERTFGTGREAAGELAEKRRKRGHVPDAVQPIEYRDDRGRKISDKETITPERGADDLKVKRQTDATAKELGDRNQLARDVDKLRANAGAPTQIDWNASVDLNAPAPDARLFGDPGSHFPPQQPQIDPQHLPQEMRPAPPGIDPDLHLAFQNPKVRQAVETEVNKAVTTATTAQRHYAENVVAAQEIALGSINAAFPEMAGVKTQAQMQEVLSRLQQTNPQRFQQAQVMLQNFARLHVERQNMERQKQHYERQNFQRESAVQDAAFAKSLANVPAQQRESVAREAISYAASLGIDERTLTHLLNTNPIMRHSAFRRMMFDAAAGSLARKGLAAQRQQNRAQVPPVIRPGSGAPRTTAQSANLQQLSARLTQSGDAKDAAALLTALRRQRGR
jgi:hypothetical protein